MCGIFGFIGRSKNPRASFEFANTLFVKTEVRGDHAAGFWSCESGPNGAIFYDKEPIKSSVYVTRDIWSNVFSKADTNLLIGHCRLSSANVGSEKCNRNNHPHMNADGTVALVHNGKIPEYNALKSKYEISSDCDSEVLLRIFESTEDYKDKEEILKKEAPTLPLSLGYRLMGLKEIFARVNYGAMAVAIGERREQNERYLYLFRDDERPIHVVDLRKTLGQIFFCSTAEIWAAAVDCCPAIRTYIPNDQPIIICPSSQIWLAGFDAEGKWLLKKWKVTKSKMSDWKSEDEAIKFNLKKDIKPSVKIITRLDEKDELETTATTPPPPPKETSTSTTATPPLVTAESTETQTQISLPLATTETHNGEFETQSLVIDGKKKESVPSQVQRSLQAGVQGDEDVTSMSSYDDTKSIDLKEFNEVMKETHSLLDQIDTLASNLAQECSLDARVYGNVMQYMKDNVNELKATLLLLMN